MIRDIAPTEPDDFWIDCYYCLGNGGAYITMSEEEYGWQDCHVCNGNGGWLESPSGNEVVKDANAEDGDT